MPHYFSISWKQDTASTVVPGGVNTTRGTVTNVPGLNRQDAIANFLTYHRPNNDSAITLTEVRETF